MTDQERISELEKKLAAVYTAALSVAKRRYRTTGMPDESGIGEHKALGPCWCECIGPDCIGQIQCSAVRQALGV